RPPCTRIPVDATGFDRPCMPQTAALRIRPVWSSGQSYPASTEGAFEHGVVVETTGAPIVSRARIKMDGQQSTRCDALGRIAAQSLRRSNITLGGSPAMVATAAGTFSHTESICRGI